MMNEAIKTHKETVFGWALWLQNAVADQQARLARRALEQTARMIADVQATPRRFLAPR